MNTSQSANPALTGGVTDKVAHRVCWVSTIVAGIAWAAALTFLCLPAKFPRNSGWPEAILVVAVTGSLMAGLARRLPIQNVALVTAVVGGIGGAATFATTVTGVPFGPLHFSGSAGPMMFSLAAWFVPFLWVTTIFMARGVSRLILRPWRKTRRYGFWVIGFTAGLSVVLQLALDPYASAVKHYWFWETTKFPVVWCGAPMVNFLAVLLVALLILAFATPALIDKRVRTSRHAPDYQPLVGWIAGNGLFAVGAATHQLWPAVIFDIVATVIISIFAIRGGRW